MVGSSAPLFASSFVAWASRSCVPGVCRGGGGGGGEGGGGGGGGGCGGCRSVSLPVPASPRSSTSEPPSSLPLQDFSQLSTIPLTRPLGPFRPRLLPTVLHLRSCLLPGPMPRSESGSGCSAEGGRGAEEGRRSLRREGRVWFDDRDRSTEEDEECEWAYRVFEVEVGSSSSRSISRSKVGR